MTGAYCNGPDNVSRRTVRQQRLAESRSRRIFPPSFPWNHSRTLKEIDVLLQYLDASSFSRPRTALSAHTSINLVLSRRPLLASASGGCAGTALSLSTARALVRMSLVGAARARAFVLAAGAGVVRGVALGAVRGAAACHCYFVY